MTYTPTNWVDGATPLNRTNMMKIENELAALDSAISATPPASPFDGQLWLFPADPTNGVTWAFRYNAGSASTYKWEFIGGPRMAKEGVGGRNWTVGEGTASTNFTTLATPGPAITIARAGEYALEGQAGAVNNTAGSPAAIMLWLPSDGAGADWTGGDAIMVAAAANYGGTISCRRTRAVPAATTVELRYAGIAGTASFMNRNLWATPIRVS